MYLNMYIDGGICTVSMSEDEFVKREKEKSYKHICVFSDFVLVSIDMGLANAGIF